MCVETCESEVLERGSTECGPDALGCRRRFKRALADSVQQCVEIVLVHWRIDLRSLTRQYTEDPF
jgi:hypothetical protein